MLKTNGIFISNVSVVFSPLQTCGLIFFSRKVKKEREGKPWTLLARTRKSCIMLQILLMLQPTPERHRVSQEQLCLRVRTRVLFPLEVMLAKPNILILSSQQFLSRRQRAILIARDCSKNIEYNILHNVINQRYRFLFFVDVVAMQSLFI